MSRIFSFLLFFIFAATACSQTVVKKVQQLDDAAYPNWAAPENAQKNGSGFSRDGNEFLCENTSAKDNRGVVFWITLNQQTPLPIIAEGWSKADEVNGSPSYNDYSLYMDISYTDGTNKWGVAAPFDTGTHDWQKKQVVFHPEKPVKSLGFYALFRGRTGKVRFKDLKLFAPKKELLCFDSVPIEEPKVSSNAVKKITSYQLRDVAADSDFVQLEKSTLGIQAAITTKKLNGSGTYFEITLNNPDGKDRCLTFILAFNLYTLKNKQFCDIRSMVPVKGEMSLPASQHQIGSSGRLSRYPFMAIAGETASGNHVGYCIGIDLSSPAFFRLGYNAHTDELFAAVDLALTKEVPKAALKFVAFAFEGKDGLHGAAAGYHQRFPDFFRCRTSKQGIWMPFSSISKVPHFEDFGFQFKEGDNEPAWDDAHGIATFRYTEPMSWWMVMDKSIPRTYEAAIKHAQKLAANGDDRAKALFKSGMKHSDGKYIHSFQDTPWCVGTLWRINELPGIKDGGFHMKWNKTIADKYYSNTKTANGVDGEYVDSSEPGGLDFNRQHFSAAKCPLIFTGDDFKPALFGGFIVYEYVRKMSDDIHARNKLMMANYTPTNYSWLAPCFDILGTETNWNDGKWKPMSGEEMFYRRVMCGPKPYCFLMNTDFTKWSFEMSEKFMKRCLAFGMFPGFFSADASTKVYFNNPQLYERDRPLFKKYIPLCKKIAEAGWQPLTNANSSVTTVYVERFGENFWTVFNDAAKEQTIKITLEGTSVPQDFVNALDGKKITVKNNTVELTLAAEDVVLLVPTE